MPKELTERVKKAGAAPTKSTSKKDLEKVEEVTSNKDLQKVQEDNFISKSQKTLKKK